MSILAGTRYDYAPPCCMPTIALTDAEQGRLVILCEYIAAREGTRHDLTFDDACLEDGPPSLHIHDDHGTLYRVIYKRSSGWSLCQPDDRLIMMAPTLLGLLQMATATIM